MHTGISKSNLICCSICENVRVRVFFTFGARNGQACTLDLVKSSALRGLSILEGNSYLTAYGTVKRNRAAVCGLDGKSGNNGSPYTVVEHLDRCVITSGFFTAVVERIEGHQVKLVGVIKSNLKRVSIGICICYGISCRLIAVECKIKIGYTGMKSSACKSKLILCSTEKDVLGSRKLACIVAATGHLAYTDIVTSKGLV